MVLYFAGGFEQLHLSKKNERYLPILDTSARLLSYHYICNNFNELYLRKGEIYENQQK